MAAMAVGRLSAQRGAASSRSWAEHRWHELDVNAYPPDQALFKRDVGRLIQEYALVGHAPPKPVLTEGDSVITMGSCFAGELRNFLKKAGFPAGKLRVPAGLNNTFALLDFVSWCVTGEETDRGFRYDRLDTGEISEWKPESEQAACQASFAEAGAFVVTLGLAEVWQDRETGGVFWRGVPESIFDADRHEFRLSTVEENVHNIRRIVELMRQVNPAAPIVLTLSPVPLKATFRDISCLSADAVSKSVLRVALDQVMRDAPEGVYYWPSFEIVKWAGAHYPWPAYGFDDKKPRHVSRYLVAQIIDAFVDRFYTPEAVAAMKERRAAETMHSPATLAAKVQAARYRRRRAGPLLGVGVKDLREAVRTARERGVRRTARGVLAALKS
jgi:hypothetical protein